MYSLIILNLQIIRSLEEKQNASQAMNYYQKMRKMCLHVERFAMIKRVVISTSLVEKVVPRKAGVGGRKPKFQKLLTKTKSVLGRTKAGKKMNTTFTKH